MSKKKQPGKIVMCVDPRGKLQALIEKGGDAAAVQVIRATDGAEALHLIEQHSPDVIVSDLETPVYSGAGLSLSLKGFAPKKIPMLLVFPSGSKDAAEVAARCDADNFVVGDPTPEAMGAIVRGLLREAAAHHRIRYVEERLRREQRRVNQAADMDAQTGFLPMGVFKRVLLTEAKRASRYHIPLGLVLVGFDAYMPLKTRYGERALAPLFSDISQVILLAIRDIDIPVRSGPDAAMIMLPHTDTQGAKRVGDRIAGQARMLRVDVEHNRVQATVSVGVAAYDGVGQISFAELLRRARTALDHVRAKGGDGLAVR